jgi:hypothetical protein
MTPTAREILIHLATATEGMTTRALMDHCPSALDRTSVSRAAYDLRKDGLISEVGTTPSHQGRGARPIALYAITQAGRSVLGGEQPADQLPGALDEAPDEDRQAAAAAWNNGETWEPGPAECPTCAGDDQAAPCAYPSEDQPGCLRSQPDPEREAAISSAVSIATADDPVLLELQALDASQAAMSVADAKVHAKRLRALADSVARLARFGYEAVATYLWLHQLADQLAPEEAPQ